MNDVRTRLISWSLIVLAAAIPARGGGDAPRSPAPPMPPDLAVRVSEVTDAVLANHIDPPTRQEMILSGLKMLYQESGVPAPLGLGRRVSEIATTEQLAALLKENWPATTARPISAHVLEEVILGGLVVPVPGDSEWMTAREGKVAEQFAGNRYVGLHIALKWDEKTERPVMAEVFPGGPADRAGIQSDDVIEEVEGVDTKGQELRAVVERLRGEEGTDVTIKVRRPKENTVRMLTITRGTLPHATIGGYRKQPSGEWTLRIEGPAPIGCLRINEITASTPHEVRKLAARMESEGLRALVLDLRRTQTGRGGSVHPAILLADSLLESGTIGRVRTVRGETTYQADSDALFRGWPIAVLVDHGTSGNAEWIAAALQDNRRAVVVGSATRGAHVAMAAGLSPREAAGFYEATVRTTVPVGDGRWMIAMPTGYLERGDGRPLADRDWIGPHLPGKPKAPQGGVQPDHPIGVPVPRPSAPSARREIRRTEPDEREAVPGADPSLTAAVAILQQALEKR